MGSLIFHPRRNFLYWFLYIIRIIDNLKIKQGFMLYWCAMPSMYRFFYIVNVRSQDTVGGKSFRITWRRLMCWSQRILLTHFKSWRDFYSLKQQFQWFEHKTMSNMVWRNKLFSLSKSSIYHKNRTLLSANLMVSCEIKCHGLQALAIRINRMQLTIMSSV